MRVIAGKYKGTVLNEFKGNDIRPTSDRAKEAIFNIIQTVIQGSTCLDLCCGTGNLGIEALSRGAEKVVFVDVAKDSVALTKKNLQKIREDSAVYTSDALAFLSTTKEKFDIIFIDPPYANDVSEKAVKIIVDRNILTDEGFIIFERDRPFGFVDGASVFKYRKYGKAHISLIRKEKVALFAGTFDPFTLGHQSVVDLALSKYDKLHVVVMSNPDKKPYFNVADRIKIINELYSNDDRIVVDLWDGLLVDYMKTNNLVYNVRGVRDEIDLEYEKNMEDYNKTIYPQIIYDYIFTENPISSTVVRRRLECGEEVGDLVSDKVLKYINNN